MRGPTIGLLLIAGWVALSAPAAGNQLRASAIASSGALSSNGTQRLGFTVGLPVTGLASTATRHLISGFWRWGDGEASGIPIDVLASPALPAVTALGAPFPNPSPLDSTFPFQIAGAADAMTQVVLEIYDVGGRCVVTLVDEAIPPGFYGVRWNQRNGSGTRAASGVYFARLTAGNIRKTARLVIID